jgi:hypothetical protein
MPITVIKFGNGHSPLQIYYYFFLLFYLILMRAKLKRIKGIKPFSERAFRLSTNPTSNFRFEVGFVLFFTYLFKLELVFHMSCLHFHKIHCSKRKLRLHRQFFRSPGCPLHAHLVQFMTLSVYILQIILYNSL